VRGLQSGDLRDGVIATGKYFLGYALSEGGMNHAPVQLGPRELREVDAEPFAAAIRDAGLASVMNSYSSVDRIPRAGSPAIREDVLRGGLGFEGVVVADYFAVELLATHHRSKPVWPRLHSAPCGPASTSNCRVESATARRSGPWPTKASCSVQVPGRPLRGSVRRHGRGGIVRDARQPPLTAANRRYQALARRAAVASTVLLQNRGSPAPARRSEVQPHRDLRAGRR